MNRQKKLTGTTGTNRRRFLMGLGACFALPALESTIPSVFGASSLTHGAELGLTETGAPLRMAFLCFPNGAHQDNWFPDGEGKEFVLGKTMQPLVPLRDSIQVLGGLDHQNATPGSDGGGDHARGNSTFLTGARARKTDSTDIKLGISVDQVVAKKVGHLTRLPSLELSCDHKRNSGSCDSGYSCAYQYNISWASSTLPVAPETNPRMVFERLFGMGSPAERQKNLQQRLATQKSLLDVIMDDTRSIQKTLSGNDKGKLDEYLTSVRELEKRIERAESFGDLPDPGVEPPPKGIPQSYGEHMDMMYELLSLAFQTDSTRISTLLLAHDGSNRSFPEIGVPDGHHDCSHHGNRPARLEKIAKIDLFYMQHFAKFLENLNQKKDIDGRSILDNSMIVYGSGNADGNRHTHSNLPIVLAGKGGGSLQSGRYKKLGGQPMSNLFLSMADRMGATGIERIGDSTGRLSDI